MKLEKNGILESTIVFITSDETAGEGGHVLSDSLGTMVVMVPEKESRLIDHSFAQSDVAFSVMDALNIEDHPFTGRSMFRNYRDERPLYFANIFQQKAYCYYGQKLYIQHYSGEVEVLGLPKLDLDQTPVSASSTFYKDFPDFIEASDRGLNILTKPIIVDIGLIEPNEEESVKGGGAIKVGLKKGQDIKLRFIGSNTSSDTPIVLLWLIQDMKNKRSFKLNNIILPGSKETYEKVFTSPDNAWYDLSFKVTAQQNKDWRIEALQVS